MSQRQTFREFAKIAQRWSDLAERRREHYAEIARSGRWKHYYTEDELLHQLKQVFDAADNWTEIARTAKDLLDPSPRKPIVSFQRRNAA
jgi:uncharacterized repeat protein (TIGR03809 family)